MLNAVAPSLPMTARSAPSPQGPKPAWAYMEPKPGEPVVELDEPIGGGIKNVPANLINPFIDNAKKFIGQEYVWGGGHNASTRVSGVDCSGLVLQAARMAGFNIDGTAAMQQDMGRPVGMNELKPGDLVFHGDPASHVGLYMGDHKVVHASSTNDRIMVVDLRSYTYFNNARRIFDHSNGGPAPAPHPDPKPEPKPEPKPDPKPAPSPAGPVPNGSHSPAGPIPDGSNSPAGPIPGASNSPAGPLPTATASPAGPIPTYTADTATFSATALAAAPVAPVALAPTPVGMPAAPATPWAWRAVQPGESLPRIAQALLGDMNRWPEIHALNPDLLPNPNVLMPGQTIRVPAVAPAPVQVAAAMPAAPAAPAPSGLSGQLAGLQQMASGLLSTMGVRPA